MKHLFAPLSLAAVGLAILLSFSGCAQVAQVANTVCTDMAKIPPDAAAALNALDPHTALGVYWADAKSACINGVPTVGVTGDWANQMWGAVKGLLPQVLPSLIPLLVGIL